jgi:hypothetical protein
MSLDVIEAKAHSFADFVIRNEASLHPIVNCPGPNSTEMGAFSLCQKTPSLRGPISIACPVTTHNQLLRFVPQHLLGRILDALLAFEE